MLLAVVQTPAPIPGQAADNPADSGGNIQKRGKSDKPNGQSTASDTPQNGARPAKTDAENPGTENASNSVTIRKLPTVSVGKDWADWSYWGFGGILVIVGGLQVWLLRGTLKAVEIQGKHMERQTKALEDSVAIAKESAEAAKASAEAASA